MKKTLAIAMCAALALLALTGCNTASRNRGVYTPRSRVTINPNTRSVAPGSRSYTTTRPYGSTAPRTGMTPYNTAPYTGTLPRMDTTPRANLTPNRGAVPYNRGTTPRTNLTPSADVGDLTAPRVSAAPRDGVRNGRRADATPRTGTARRGGSAASRSRTASRTAPRVSPTPGAGTTPRSAPRVSTIPRTGTSGRTAPRVSTIPRTGTVTRTTPLPNRISPRTVPAPGTSSAARSGA